MELFLTDEQRKTLNNSSSQAQTAAPKRPSSSPQSKQNSPAKTKAIETYNALTDSAKRNIDRLIGQYKLLSPEEKEQYVLIFKGLMAGKNEAE